MAALAVAAVEIYAIGSFVGALVVA